MIAFNSRHKIYLIFSLSLLFSTIHQTGFAQFGVSLRHAMSFNDYPDVQHQSSRSHAGMISADYRYGLKEYRLGIGIEPYAKFQKPVGNFTPISQIAEDLTIKDAKSIGANLYVSYYPLDFVNCNCPTINKKGLWFKQSLFIQPEIGFEVKKFYTTPSAELSDLDQLISAALFVGVDIPYFYPLMISPMLGVKKYFQLNDNPLFGEKRNPIAVEAGIRFGFGRL